jgi:AcrR family transcriptional regulator
VPTKIELTRERLLAAAIELFDAQGYDATSAAQIAAKAGVSQMTFFRYFPTKESLLVADPYDPVIGDAVRDQPTHLDPLTRAARGILSAWQSLPEPSGDEVRARLRIVAQTPNLRSALARGSAETESVIREALASGGTPAPDAGIAAAAVMAALNTALLDWSLSADRELGTAITDAVRVIEARHG